MIFGSILLLPTLKKKFNCRTTMDLSRWVPKILLLFPCWLLGCLAYHVSKSFRTNIVLSTISRIIQRIFFSKNNDRSMASVSPWQYEGLGNPPLFYSAKFFEDYKIAGSLAIFSLFHEFLVFFRKKSNGILALIIRKLANCSFSLYAIHFPVMAFIAAFWANGTYIPLGYVGGIILVIAICCLFAVFF